MFRVSSYGLHIIYVSHLEYAFVKISSPYENLNKSIKLTYLRAEYLIVEIIYRAEVLHFAFNY